MMRKITVLVLAVLSAVCLADCSGEKEQQEQKDEKILAEVSDERAAEIFSWYAEQIGLDIPKERHAYILVCEQACGGCIHEALQYCMRNCSDTLTCVTTVRVVNSHTYGYAKGCECLYVDTVKLLDDLNWHYCNIIELHTENGRLVDIRDYATDEIMKRFSGKDTVMTECEIPNFD